MRETNKTITKKIKCVLVCNVPMKLSLPVEMGFRYKSGCQKSRAISEKWFGDNFYCLNCTSNSLEQTPNNEKVVDFICPKCNEKYQMKAMAHRFGNRIIDSAYAPKIEYIMTGNSPNFVFMHYNKVDMTVQNIIIVPKHFVSPEIIEKRFPLKKTAERHDWIGSFISIGRLPLDARIYFVQDGMVVPQKVVRETWKNFLFVRDIQMASKGWMIDVLAAVRKIGKKEFELSEIYSFEREFSKLHPGNRNIKPKIRQQLQFLRDKGVLEFVGDGRYRVLK